MDSTGLPFDNPKFGESLCSVRHDRATKLFLWYEEDWWTEMNLHAGASTTDLPLRQCFYFGTERAPDGRSGGLLMASYNDDSASDYWDAYAHRPSFVNRDGFASVMSPPVELLDDVQWQLQALHQRELPRPHSAIFQDWNVDPYAGGWHHWEPNWRPWAVMELMQQPIEDVGVHVCGEAYSATQGWVMGALDTAEAMLQGQFSIDKAGWLADQQ